MTRLRCRKAAAAAGRHRPTAALPPPLPPLRNQRCCRADAATTALPPHPSPCCHLHRRANAAITATLTTRPRCCQAAAAAATAAIAFVFYFRCHCCCRHCHGIELWHREEGEEDKRGSKQRVRAAHRWGDAPPPAPRRYLGRRIAGGEGPRPQTRCRGSLLLPPLERNVDDDDNNDVAASGTPAAIGTWAKAEAVDAAWEYFLMLGRVPAYFWVDFFVQESKRFILQQNLILFYPWCYYDYATQ